MTKIKVGILAEGKTPIDRRVPITPMQVKQVQSDLSNVEILCQKSALRSFSDQEYIDVGVQLSDSMDDCDILLGIKEVQIDELIPEKTYMFFSHTVKKQIHNRELLKEIINKKIKLIDYECLTTPNGNRVVAFGRYAGIVGGYNGILTFGKRYNLFSLRRAHQCHDLDDLKSEFKKTVLPQLKISIIGGGRVAKGAMEVLLGMGVRRVTPSVFLSERFNEPVFTQLNARDYNKHKQGNEFSRRDFYQHPDNYDSDFNKYSKVTDILIAAALLA